MIWDCIVEYILKVKTGSHLMNDALYGLPFNFTIDKTYFNFALLCLWNLILYILFWCGHLESDSTLNLDCIWSVYCDWSTNWHLWWNARPNLILRCMHSNWILFLHSGRWDFRKIIKLCMYLHRSLDLRRRFTIW